VPTAGVAAASSPAEVFLACLAAMTRQGRRVSASKNSINYAPKIFARMPEAHGVRDKVLEKTMEILFTADAIKVGDVWDGPQRKQRGGIVAMSESGDAGRHPDVKPPNDIDDDIGNCQ